MSLSFKKPLKPNTPEQNAAMAKAIEEHEALKEQASKLPPLPEAPKSLTFKKPYKAPAGRRRKTKRSNRKGRKAHRK